VKRWIFTILLFLLLVSGGAIVNVAVAWGFAALIDPPVPGQLFAAVIQSNQSWSISRYAGVGETLYVSVQVQLGEPVQEDSIAEGGHPRDLLPGWAEVGHPLPGDITSRFQTFDCSGWPCRALWCESIEITRQFPAHLSPSTKIPGGGGLDVGLSARGPFSTPRSLPLRPIWPGFAFNTLFYALILWLLIPGPFVLRRVIRIKRGRCPKCGYDLRGAPSGGGCPECGWSREAETESARGGDTV
jgi:hypothetical protein